MDESDEHDVRFPLWSYGCFRTGFSEPNHALALGFLALANSIVLASDPPPWPTIDIRWTMTMSYLRCCRVIECTHLRLYQACLCGIGCLHCSSVLTIPVNHEASYDCYLFPSFDYYYRFRGRFSSNFDCSSRIFSSTRRLGCGYLDSLLLWMPPQCNGQQSQSCYKHTSRQQIKEASFLSLGREDR